jgi:hypothetical protein
MICHSSRRCSADTLFRRQAPNPFRYCGAAVAAAPARRRRRPAEDLVEALIEGFEPSEIGKTLVCGGRAEADDYVHI